MNISQLLDQKGNFVATITPSVSVREAIASLAEHNVGALVVSTNGETIDGIVSERDVVRSLASDGAAILDRPVSGLMSSVVATCKPDDLVDSLMVTMTEHRVRHLPVVDGQGRLVGIVSIGDIVKSRVDELEKDRDALVDFIHAR